MADVEKILSDYGLSREKYKEMLNDCADKVNKTSEYDWDEILSKYNISWNPDTARKAQQPPLLGGAFVKQFYEDEIARNCGNNDNDTYFRELDLKKRELEKERVKLRDERNEYRKQNRIEARVEQKLDYLGEQLAKQGKVNFDRFFAFEKDSENDMLVILSDLHIGQCFKSFLGEYNIDIAKDRLNKYLKEIIAASRLYNTKDCYVSLQGDLISGSIHKTIQITNSENVIGQIKAAVEMITSFIYELAREFNNVYFYNVSGNHTRLDKKEDSLHDERLDDLISWDIARSLSHVDNVHVLNANYDTGIAAINIRGKIYLSVHGDFDQFNKTGIANLSLMIGGIPYAVIYGHLHHNSFDEEANVKMIRGGTLSGSGDQYTIEKRLYSKPSQMMCICNASGVKAYLPVEL